jgi:hypothetical protein
VFVGRLSNGAAPWRGLRAVAGVGQIAIKGSVVWGFTIGIVIVIIVVVVVISIVVVVVIGIVVVGIVIVVVVIGIVVVVVVVAVVVISIVVVVVVIVTSRSKPRHLTNGLKNNFAFFLDNVVTDIFLDNPCDRDLDLFTLVLGHSVALCRLHLSSLLKFVLNYMSVLTGLVTIVHRFFFSVMHSVPLTGTSLATLATTIEFHS